MARERGFVPPLEQRCIEPGHWIIEGRDVRAVYEGRGRHVMGWTVQFWPGEEDHPAGAFGTLREAREWIAGQR